ncbi:MAG: GAF domain-containing protein [Desulfosporosinus sp.]
MDKLDTVLESIVSKVASTLEGRVILLLPNENAKLVLMKDSGSDDFLNESELAVATWVFEKGQKAGRGTETLGAAAALYLPLSAEQGAQGVLGICFNESEAQFDPERIRLLEAFVGLAAMAINRIKLAEQARQALTLAEAERLSTAQN